MIMFSGIRSTSDSNNAVACVVSPPRTAPSEPPAMAASHLLSTPVPEVALGSLTIRTRREEW